MIAPRPLPRSGLVLSPLGLGTAALGDRSDDGAADDAAKTVDLAIASGVSYLDTAPHYGIGLAERRAGAALARHPRDRFTLSTKVGRVIDERARTETFDFSPAAVLSSLEGSLRRLGLAKADILYVHDPDHAEAAARQGAFPVLRALRAEGTVRAIGVGMNQAAMLERFVTDPALGVDLVLLAGRYTLLDQSGLRLLGRCQERGVGVVLGGVFNSGILADPRPGASYDYRPAPDELVARARALATACERHGVPLPAAALRFGLGHPAVVSVLNGAGSPAELTANLAHAATAVPPACWEELRSQRLLPPGVPVPGEV
ncbi:MAG TPA: aldo/keto reductase [Streptosporangiaceae bacterium]|nr:aldo/keto reductase [Streptosporangiaceae bacterium]